MCRPKSTDLARPFRRFARTSADWLGSSQAFVLAILAVIIWACLGPRFEYSDTWQLVINTATSVMTFLMVFLLQNTQNRDAKALHLKRDELIRAVKGARTGLVQLESMTQTQLDDLEREFHELRQRSARRRSREASQDEHSSNDTAA